MSKSKNIVITGTSRGIGLELVKWFAAAGHHVWALSRNSAPTELLKLPNITSVSLDLTDEVAVNEWAVSFAPSTIDVLINNAGALINKAFTQTTQADFEYVYRVNVFGLANISRALIAKLQPSGHILNVSSMGGINGTSKFPGLAAYSSSKGAVSILTELLAEEFKESGPFVNALALGAVQTEMLSDAFPGLEVPMDASTMAAYIATFALEGHHFYNGKVLPVSNTTP